MMKVTKEAMKAALSVKNATMRKTQTYSFERYGNNYVEAGQAIAEILWNAFGAGAAKTVWVEYHDNMLRIFNDGKPVVLANVFQYGISVRLSMLSSYGTGVPNTSAFFNPSNTNFGMNSKMNGKYYGIRAPFAEYMAIGELCDEDIERMNAISPKVTTEYFVFDENSILADFDFMGRLGKMCALQIKNGKKVFFNGQPVAPVILDCGKLGKRGAPRWDSSELVRTECGNFVLQYANIDASEDKSKSLENQGAWLYFNNMFLENKGVGMFHADGKTTPMKAHPAYNGMRTIINIVTDGVENALDMPFNNTKTGISWGKKAARAMRDAIDEIVGGNYRCAQRMNSEAGKRKCVDYICKTMFGCTPVNYTVEVGLKPYKLTCDAMIYSGEKFSLDNVRAGKTVVHGIVEFKKSAINCNNVGQVVNYLLSAMPADMPREKMPKLIFVGTDIGKEVHNQMANINMHLRDESKFEYAYLNYKHMNKLFDDIDF